MNKLNLSGVRRAAAFAAAAILLASCSEDSVLGPDSTDVSDAPLRRDPSVAAQVTVMTRNLYVGAPVEMIYAPGADIPKAAAALWKYVGDTNFPERAQAIAEEVERVQPHVIGLQEMSVFQIITPYPMDAVPGLTPTIEELNFLVELQTALVQRGLYYEPVSAAENFLGFVPMENGQSPTGYSLIALADLDVILVKDGVNYSNPYFKRFDTNEIVGLAGQELEIYRGWASIDLSIEGLDFRFVTTHLEPESTPEIQVAQGDELLVGLDEVAGIYGDLPVIVTGDINSAADGSDTPTYGNLADAGFKDAWGKRGGGLTCCQAEDLLSPWELTRRVDVILLRGDFGLYEPGVLGAVHATIFGNKEADRTPSGLWPSDHAGVAANIFLPMRATVN
jgi:hypothetical protein